MITCQMERTFTANEVGRTFANSPGDIQAAFLVAAMKATEEWEGIWDMQAEFICDALVEFGDETRRDVAHFLEAISTRI